jgi:hypothetical protein
VGIAAGVGLGVLGPRSGRSTAKTPITATSAATPATTQAVLLEGGRWGAAGADLVHRSQNGVAGAVDGGDGLDDVRVRVHDLDVVAELIGDVGALLDAAGLRLGGGAAVIA